MAVKKELMKELLIDYKRNTDLHIIFVQTSIAKSATQLMVRIRFGTIGLNKSNVNMGVIWAIYYMLLPKEQRTRVMI